MLVADKGKYQPFFFFLIDTYSWYMLLGFIKTFSDKYMGFFDSVPPLISPLSPLPPSS